MHDWDKLWSTRRVEFGAEGVLASSPPPKAGVNIPLFVLGIAGLTAAVAMASSAWEKEEEKEERPEGVEKSGTFLKEVPRLSDEQAEALYNRSLIDSMGNRNLAFEKMKPAFGVPFGEASSPEFEKWRGGMVAKN